MRPLFRSVIQRASSDCKSEQPYPGAIAGAPRRQERQARSNPAGLLSAGCHPQPGLCVSIRFLLSDLRAFA